MLWSYVRTTTTTTTTKKNIFFFKSAILSRLRRRTHMHTQKKNNRMFRYGVSVCVCEQQCVCMSLAQRHYRFANSCIKSHVWTFSEHCFFFARFYHINAKFIPILMLLLCNLRQHNDSVKRAFHRIQIQCSRPKTSRKMISVFFFSGSTAKTYRPCQTKLALLRNFFI